LSKRLHSRPVQLVLSAPQGTAITTALIVGGLSAPEIAGVMRQFWVGRHPGGVFRTPPDSAG
jgi:hypothetical protein